MNELTQRVEHARQRWNAGDLPGYLSLYDEQIKLHGYTPEPMNKEAVTGFYQMVWSTMAANGKQIRRSICTMCCPTATGTAAASP